jgi:hypothetical protein
MYLYRNVSEGYPADQSDRLMHTHMDTDSQAVRKKLLRSLDVNIPGSRGRSRVEVWVVRGEFTTEG